jgi:type II restriction enzyme
MGCVPAGYDEVAHILSEIDVVWVKQGGNTIEGLFEVEHSTSIYSGLLRFNDLLLTNPKLAHFSIVSDDSRRSVFARQLHRPTFQRSGLSELTSFLDYRNVYDWHSRLARSGHAIAVDGMCP